MMIRQVASKLIIVVMFLAGAAAAQNRYVPEWIKREKFLRACEMAEIDKVKAYLAAGISPNSRDVFGQPALLRAVIGFDVFRNTPEVVRLLLAAGADINAANDFGTTAIFISIRHPDSEMNPHKLLLNSGADTKRKDKDGVTFDQRASEDERQSEDDNFIWRMIVEDRISWSADWTVVRRVSRNSGSATTMMAAAYYGIILGTPPDRIGSDWQREVDKNGENYLFYLASRTKFSTDDLLAVDNIAANTANDAGETPLMRAARFDNDWLVRKLLMAGAIADRRDKSGHTALEYAAEYDNFASTFLLLARTDANLKSRDGRTPLMTAADRGNSNAVRAYANAKEFAAKMPTQARKMPAAEAKEALATAERFARISLNLQDNSGMTALMLAAANGHRDIVGSLLRINANKAIKDKKGRTARDLARLAGYADIVKILQ